MNVFNILFVAAYADAAKYQASGQIFTQKLYNVEFEFKIEKT